MLLDEVTRDLYVVIPAGSLFKNVLTSLYLIFPLGEANVIKYKKTIDKLKLCITF